MSIQTLALTDGVLTASLVDGTNFNIIASGWGPRVARRRRSDLGGGPYANEIEDISLNLTGASEAVILANQETLAILVNQAYDWEQGRDVLPVKLQITMSSGTLLEAAVYGDGSVASPSSWSDLLMVQEINQVRLTLERHGLWLQAAGIENYVENWSFENHGGPGTGATSIPDWTTFGGPTLGLDSEQTVPGVAPTSGLLVAKITGTAGSNKGILQDVGGLTNGVTYTISADIKRISGAVTLSAEDGGGGGSLASVVVSSGTAWGRVSITRAAPASGSIQIRLYTNTAAGGSAYFDSILLHPTIAVIDNVDVNESSAAVAGVPLSVTLGDVDIQSPLEVELLMCNASGVEVSTVFSHWPSYLILTNAIDNIQTQSGDDFTITGAPWTNPAAAGADQSYGGNLLRFSPTLTTPSRQPVYDFTLSAPGMAANTRLKGLRLVAFAVVKASVANNFTLRAYASANAVTADYEIASEPVVITSTATQIVPLIFPAPLRASYFFGTVTLTLEATAAAASGSLDIDRLTLVNITPECETTIVRLNESLRYDSSAFFAGRVYLNSDPTDHAIPEVGIRSTTAANGDLPFSHDGAADCYMSGDQVAGCLIAIGDARATTPGTLWQWYDSTNTFVIRNRLRVTRRRGKVIPQ